MKITVETFTFTELLRKALEFGYRHVSIAGSYEDIEEVLEEEAEDEEEDTPDYLMVGCIIFNVANIMKKDDYMVFYVLDY